ncbi:unnamed protein product, partial [Polarella glacialis]
YSAKLMRASQLRRPDGLLALGEPGAPAGPEVSPSSLLVVAFSASQGEPEWLGLCRRLVEAKQVVAQAPDVGSLQDLLQGVDQNNFE